MLDDRGVLERGQDLRDSLQDRQLRLLRQACVEVGAIDEVLRPVGGQDHLAVLLGKDPEVVRPQRVKRQIDRHRRAQTLAEDRAAVDRTAEPGAQISDPRPGGEHHRVGLELDPRGEADAGDRVAPRGEAHHLSLPELGAQLLRRLGHGQCETVGLYLTCRAAGTAHIDGVQGREELAQRVHVDPVGFDAARGSEGLEQRLRPAGLLELSLGD
jgi:hypothetical protein